MIGFLNSNKAPGIDEILTKLTKAAKYSLAPYLLKIFNNCLNNGQYSDVLKIAKITPLHISGSKSEPKSIVPYLCCQCLIKSSKLL